MTLTAAPMTKPKVTQFKTSDTTSLFMCGDMTFDDVDRNLAYIDYQIQTWLAWRGYVVEHGQYVPPEQS